MPLRVFGVVHRALLRSHLFARKPLTVLVILYLASALGLNTFLKLGNELFLTAYLPTKLYKTLSPHQIPLAIGLYSLIPGIHPLHSPMKEGKRPRNPSYLQYMLLRPNRNPQFLPDQVTQRAMIPQVYPITTYTPAFFLMHRLA